MSRTGDWMATFTGRKWFVSDPDPADVCFEDIAHALARICRYGGHCREFYSVAQHSLLVAQEAWKRSKDVNVSLWALMHDAPEAYLGDVVRPLKYTMGVYRALELATEHVIIEALGLVVDDDIRGFVKHLDDVLLMTERRDLVNHGGHDWQVRAIPLMAPIRPAPPALADRDFTAAFEILRRKGGPL